MIVAGIGWPTFVYPPLAEQFGRFAMAPGMFGEGVFNFVLLFKVTPSDGIPKRAR